MKKSNIEDKEKLKLMELHQEKLEVALTKGEPCEITVEELELLCEFLNTFLYD